MTYNRSDLRSFLAEVDAEGSMLYIDKPVDVATEIGALCSETTRPTVFRNLKGYEDFQMVDCLTRFRETQAIALGLERGKPEAVMKGYLNLLAKGPGTTVEIEREEAPVKEVIWTGDDARLSRLPIPVPSEGMDIPHLNVKEQDANTPCMSSGMGVTKHPDGTQNTFFCMAKVINDKRMHFFLLPGHTARNVAAWAEKGERCPMTFVIGCHPAYEIGGAYTGPHDGFSELDMISTLIGGPVPTVKAETVDLQIPAYSEITIEGFIDPEKAPYLHASSHSDSFAPIISMEPFFDVTAITMRKKPIYRHIQPTRFTEHHSLGEFIVVPPLYKGLLDKGLPVKDIHLPLRSSLNCAIIQVTANNASEISEIMLAGVSNPICPRLTIVVDEDIDIYNVEDVLYAVSIRADPAVALQVISAGTRAFPEALNTLMSADGNITVLPNNRRAIDATKPPLDQPERRLEFVRLKAKGEDTVKLADFI